MKVMTELELLTVEQAARLLGLGRSTTYGLVAAGELPSVRVGRALRIPRRRLRKWIDGKALETKVTDPVPGGPGTPEIQD
jgi:excisionase family DNA binding protein